jgi:hypothetical protein
LKSMILAQNERWRRGSGMQVARQTNSNIGIKWRTGE